jgi:diguanylate cyclase (GGDEF)-like protein
MALCVVEIVWFALNFAEKTGPPILGTAPVMVGAAVTVLSFRRAWQAPGLSKPAVRFWRSMTLASTGVTLVQLTDLPGYLEKPTITPNPASLVVYTAAMTIIIVSLYRLPLATRGPGSRLRLLLDCSTVTLAALLLIWYAALNRMSASDASKLLATTTFASVALALVVLALAKVHFTAGRTIDPRALRCLGAGLSAQMVGVFLTPLILDRPQIAGEPLGRSALYVLVAAGAAYQCRGAVPSESAGPRRRERTFSPVPFLAVAVVDAFLLWAIHDHSADVLVIGGGAVALTGLVVARQLAAFGENNRLINEVRSYHDKLEYQATHDSLTGLANRSLLGTELERATADPATRLSLAVVDLDDFKPVNDTYGHHTGDGLLVAVAERLRASVRPEDLVARLGGDEFAVLLRGLTTETADDVGHRILGTLQQPLTINGHDLTVRASVGVVDASEAEDPAHLMQRADEAMYRAKQAAKGSFGRYDAGTGPAAAPRAGLVEDLARATDEGQLVLHYQPIVALPDDAVVGVEALVRWQHPERGTVPPLDFIPAAEQSGLILPIGRWVLVSACAQAADWLRTGHSTLSVLSACPVDQLKLDRSFTDPRNAPVAIAVARIAESLGVEMVAEGVESAAQAARLHEIGYGLAQGFHFSRPLPAADLEARLAASQPLPVGP